MADFHCKTCERKSKKNYRSYEFVPYTLDTWYYDSELVFDVVDEDGNTVPMRSPEFNGTVGDA